MKQIRLQIILLTILYYSVVASTTANAQEWKWGIAPQFAPAEPGFSGFMYGAIAADAFGDVFISGSTFNLYSCIFGPDTVVPQHYWYNQPVVAKCDSSGHFLWAINARSANASPVGITTDAAGNLYLFGSYITDSVCIIGTDTLKCPDGINASVFFIAKIDPDGHVLWAKNVVIPQGANSVSSGLDYVGPYGGVCLDGAGNIYIAGIFGTTSVSIGSDTIFNADATASTNDFFVAKLDSSGNALWAGAYGGTDNDYVNSIAVSPSGNVYLAGSYISASMAIGATTMTNAGNANNIFIAKFDSSGHPHWARSVAGNASTTDEAEALAIDGNENLYFTGGFTLGSIHFGSLTLSGSAAGCLFIVKYDSSGNVKWAKTASSAQSSGYGIAADNCGNIWACGQMSSNLNFGGHVIATPVSPYNPTYLVELDTAGNYMNGMAIANGGGANNNIVVDDKGSFFVAGLFNSGDPLVDFIIGPDTLTIDSQYQNLFVARYVYGDTDACNFHTPTSTNANPMPANNISVYPNPATKNLTIVARDGISTVVISNLLGQTVYINHYNCMQAGIDVSNLPPGIYLVRVNGSEVTKFVKE